MRHSHILVVLGQGGHTKECLRLVDLMGAERYRYSYIVAADDDLSEQQIRIAGPIYRVVRPRDKTEHDRMPVVTKLIRSLAQTRRALWHSRPDAILTTGPALAGPVAVIAKLMGVRVLFVETGSRITALSTTGRLMRWLADLYFVQWEELKPAVPRGVFAGRLL